MPDSLAPVSGPRWVQLTGGSFVMGSDDFYDNERPARIVHVDDFLIGATPVTNRQFSAFIDATGYVTIAELPPPETGHAPGSLVFTPTDGPVELNDWRQWWQWMPGAHWRQPRGTETGLTADMLPEHPVVHVAYEDASAYAKWVGGRLPTEAELEYAACGGQRPAPYAWGPSRDLAGRLMANTWRGNFPYANTGANGWIGSSPVGTFPANAYGLFDCIGNVWEWTSCEYKQAVHDGSCTCSPVEQNQHAQTGHDNPIVHRVLKGGSHLCAPEYCLRYRPAARSSQAEDSATTHIGFRVAKTPISATTA